jgi:predicted amidophosphoribosyltransferase/phosphoglycolate phosphatase-like HAD superfamily hydrolase
MWYNYTTVYIYRYKNSLLFKAIAIALVWLFLFDSVSYAEISAPSSASKSTLAAESRIKPFFDANNLDLNFQNRWSVISAVQELRKLLIDQHVSDDVKIEWKISQLNRLFPDGAVKIINRIEPRVLKSGRAHKCVVFEFGKSKTPIEVLLFPDYADRKLTDEELEELRIIKRGQTGEIAIDERRLLDYPRLEGVWLVNPKRAVSGENKRIIVEADSPAPPQAGPGNGEVFSDRIAPDAPDANGGSNQVRNSAASANIHMQDSYMGRYKDIQELIEKLPSLGIGAPDIFSGRKKVVDVGVGGVPFATCGLAYFLKSRNPQIEIVGTELPDDAAKAHIFMDDFCLEGLRGSIIKALIFFRGSCSWKPEDITSLRFVVNNEDVVTSALVGFGNFGVEVELLTLGVSPDVAYMANGRMSESQICGQVFKELYGYVENMAGRLIRSGKDTDIDGVKIVFNPTERRLKTVGAELVVSDNISKHPKTRDADIVIASFVVQHMTEAQKNIFKEETIPEMLQENGVCIIKNTTKGSKHESDYTAGIELYQKKGNRIVLMGSALSDERECICAPEGVLANITWQKNRGISSYLKEMLRLAQPSSDSPNPQFHLGDDLVQMIQAPQAPEGPSAALYMGIPIHKLFPRRWLNPKTDEINWQAIRRDIRNAFDHISAWLTAFRSWYEELKNSPRKSTPDAIPSMAHIGGSGPGKRRVSPNAVGDDVRGIKKLISDAREAGILHITDRKADVKCVVFDLDRTLAHNRETMETGGELISTEDLRELLAMLRGNDVTLAYASAAPMRDVQETLDRLGVLDYFDGVHGGEDKAGVIHKYKDELGLEDHEIAIFGDSETDIDAAEKAGALKVGVLRSAANRAVIEKADFLVYDFTKPRLICAALMGKNTVSLAQNTAQAEDQNTPHAWMRKFSKGDVVIHEATGIATIRNINYKKGSVALRQRWGELKDVNKVIYSSSPGDMELWMGWDRITPEAVRLIEKMAFRRYNANRVCLLFGFAAFESRLKNPATRDRYAVIRDAVYAAALPENAGDTEEAKMYTLWHAIKRGVSNEPAAKAHKALLAVEDILREVFVRTGEDLVKEGVLLTFKYQNEGQPSRSWYFDTDSPPSFGPLWRMGVARHRKKEVYDIPYEIDRFYRTWLLKKGVGLFVRESDYAEALKRRASYGRAYYPVHDPRHQNDPFSQAIIALKRDPAGVSPVLVQMLKGDLERAVPWGEVDMIVPVPAREDRRKQATGLANDAAKIFGKELDSRGLVPTRETEKQGEHQTLLARVKNVAGAYKGAAAVEGKTVLVIDDITTSGATALEAQRALYAAGAKRVIFFAFGKTSEGREGGNAFERLVEGARISDYSDLFPIGDLNPPPTDEDKTLEPPAGSLAGVFEWLAKHDNPKGSTGREIAHFLGRSYQHTTYRDIKALLYLGLIEELKEAGRKTRYYVPESVKKKQGEILPILREFHGKTLRPSRKFLNEKYRDRIDKILFSESADFGESGVSPDGMILEAAGRALKNILAEMPQDIPMEEAFDVVRRHPQYEVINTYLNGFKNLDTLLSHSKRPENIWRVLIETRADPAILEKKAAEIISDEELLIFFSEIDYIGKFRCLLQQASLVSDKARDFIKTFIAKKGGSDVLKGDFGPDIATLLASRRTREAITAFLSALEPEYILEPYGERRLKALHHNDDIVPKIFWYFLAPVYERLRGLGYTHEESGKLLVYLCEHMLDKGLTFCMTDNYNIGDWFHEFQDNLDNCLGNKGGEGAVGKELLESMINNIESRPDGTAATLLTSMRFFKIFRDNPRDESGIVKKIQYPHKTIQGPLADLQAVGLVLGDDAGYYLPDWLKDITTEEIILENPELRRQELRADAQSAKNVALRVRQIEARVRSRTKLAHARGILSAAGHSMAGPLYAVEFYKKHNFSAAFLDELARIESRAMDLCRASWESATYEEFEDDITELARDSQHILSPDCLEPALQNIYRQLPLEERTDDNKKWRIENPVIDALLAKNLLAELLPESERRIRAVNINRVIKSVASFPPGLYFRAEMAFDAGDITIVTDEVALSRALLNIALRADALQVVGKKFFKIITSRADDGQGVIITVSDNADSRVTFHEYEEDMMEEFIREARDTIERRCGGMIDVRRGGGTIDERYGPVFQRGTVFTIRLPISIAATSSAGSLAGVFGYLCKNNITEESGGLAGKQIAYFLRRSYQHTTYRDIKALLYLKLIEERKEAGRKTRYYVPESVKKKQDEILPILEELKGKHLRPSRKFLDENYKGRIDEIISQNSGFIVLSGLGADKKGKALGVNMHDYDYDVKTAPIGRLLLQAEGIIILTTNDESFMISTIEPKHKGLVAVVKELMRRLGVECTIDLDSAEHPLLALVKCGLGNEIKAKATTYLESNKHTYRQISNIGELRPYDCVIYTNARREPEQHIVTEVRDVKGERLVTTNSFPDGASAYIPPEDLERLSKIEFNDSKLPTSSSPSQLVNSNQVRSASEFIAIKSETPAASLRNTWAEMKSAMGPHLDIFLDLSEKGTHRPWTKKEARSYNDNMLEIAKIANRFYTETRDRHPTNTGFWKLVNETLNWTVLQHVAYIGSYTQGMCIGMPWNPEWQKRIKEYRASFLLADNYLSNMTEIQISGPVLKGGVVIFFPGAINQLLQKKYRWILVDLEGRTRKIKRPTPSPQKPSRDSIGIEKINAGDKFPPGGIGDDQRPPWRDIVTSIFGRGSRPDIITPSDDEGLLVTNVTASEPPYVDSLIKIAKAVVGKKTSSYLTKAIATISPTIIMHTLADEILEEIERCHNAKLTDTLKRVYGSRLVSYSQRITDEPQPIDNLLALAAEILASRERRSKKSGFNRREFFGVIAAAPFAARLFSKSDKIVTPGPIDYYKTSVWGQQCYHLSEAGRRLSQVSPREWIESQIAAAESVDPFRGAAIMRYLENPSSFKMPDAGELEWQLKVVEDAQNEFSKLEKKEFCAGDVNGAILKYCEFAKKHLVPELFDQGLSVAFETGRGWMKGYLSEVGLNPLPADVFEKDLTLEGFNEQLSTLSTFFNMVKTDADYHSLVEFFLGHLHNAIAHILKRKIQDLQDLIDILGSGELEQLADKLNEAYPDMDFGRRVEVLLNRGVPQFFSPEYAKKLLEYHELEQKIPWNTLGDILLHEELGKVPRDLSSLIRGVERLRRLNLNLLKERISKRAEGRLGDIGIRLAEDMLSQSSTKPANLSSIPRSQAVLSLPPPAATDPAAVAATVPAGESGVSPDRMAPNIAYSDDDVERIFGNSMQELQEMGFSRDEILFVLQGQTSTEFFDSFKLSSLDDRKDQLAKLTDAFRQMVRSGKEEIVIWALGLGIGPQELEETLDTLYNVIKLEGKSDKIKVTVIGCDANDSPFIFAKAEITQQRYPGLIVHWEKTNFDYPGRLVSIKESLGISGYADVVLNRDVHYGNVRAKEGYFTVDYIKNYGSSRKPLLEAYLQIKNALSLSCEGTVYLTDPITGDYTEGHPYLAIPGMTAYTAGSGFYVVRDPSELRSIKQLLEAINKPAPADVGNVELAVRRKYQKSSQPDDSQPVNSQPVNSNLVRIADSSKSQAAITKEVNGFRWDMQIQTDYITDRERKEQFQRDELNDKGLQLITRADPFRSMASEDIIFVYTEMLKNSFNAIVDRILKLRNEGAPVDFEGRIVTEVFFDREDVVINIIDNGETIDFEKDGVTPKRRYRNTDIQFSAGERDGGSGVIWSRDAVFSMDGSITYYPLKEGTKTHIRIPRNNMPSEFYIEKNEHITVETDSQVSPQAALGEIARIITHEARPDGMHVVRLRNEPAEMRKRLPPDAAPDVSVPAGESGVSPDGMVPGTHAATAWRMRGFSLSNNIRNIEPAKESLSLECIFPNALRYVNESMSQELLAQYDNVTITLPEDAPSLYLISVKKRGLITTALYHLFQNALKYSRDAHSRIGVDISVGEAGSLAIKISDHGIGIPAEEIAKIMDLSSDYRASNAVYYTRGTGMGGGGAGFNHAHRIIKEDLGGTLKLESVLHKGTTVTITVPGVIVSAATAEARVSSDMMVPDAENKHEADDGTSGINTAVIWKIWPGESTGMAKMATPGEIRETIAEVMEKGASFNSLIEDDVLELGLSYMYENDKGKKEFPVHESIGEPHHRVDCGIRGSLSPGWIDALLTLYNQKDSNELRRSRNNYIRLARFLIESGWDETEQTDLSSSTQACLKNIFESDTVPQTLSALAAERLEEIQKLVTAPKVETRKRLPKKERDVFSDDTEIASSAQHLVDGPSRNDGTNDKIRTTYDKTTARVTELASAEKEADRIHQENLEYAKYTPAPNEKKVLCHIIADSALPYEQREQVLKMLDQDQDMKGKDYKEKIVRFEDEKLKLDNFVDGIKGLMKIKEIEYKKLYGEEYDIEFDVACPGTAFVTKILEDAELAKRGVKALAFEAQRPGADATQAESVIFTLVQAEGIVLALRALRSDNFDILKRAYEFLASMAGHDMSKDEWAKIKNIDDFMRMRPFILPISRVDVNRIRDINDLIVKNIKTAA